LFGFERREIERESRNRKDWWWAVERAKTDTRTNTKHNTNKQQDLKNLFS
jgi:hypothetical protein